MSKRICLYKFPLHPADMFAETRNMSESTRILRTQMIEMISCISQVYSQTEIDENVRVHLNEKKEIIGLDMSNLLLQMDGNDTLPADMRALKSMTSETWITMRYA